MGGISAGVGGGGGSARLYWVPFWNPWGEGRNVQETWHTILDTPYVAFYIPHWTGSTLDFTVYTIESTPLHFILYKLYFTFLALHCTPDTPQEQETMGFFTFHQVWQWWGSIDFAEGKLRGSHAKVRNSTSTSKFCRWWIHPSVYQLPHLLASISQTPWWDDVSEFQSWAMYVGTYVRTYIRT